MPDGASIADQGIQNDGVLYMVYRTEGGGASARPYVCCHTRCWSRPLAMHDTDAVLDFVPHQTKNNNHCTGDGWEDVDVDIVTGSGQLK